MLDRPSSPTNVSVQNGGESNLINISWIATSMMGVNQYYTIVLDMYTFETTQLYYIFQQNTSDVKCSVYITAVNGAGESEPSNNVSIPSLPDIGPVTASLTHQVWKNKSEIRVNISFEVRRDNNHAKTMYCMWYQQYYLHGNNFQFQISKRTVLCYCNRDNYCFVCRKLNHVWVSLY